MSLIEKIEAEIERLHEEQKSMRSGVDAEMVWLKIEEAEKIKEIIISEQKEPCDCEIAIPIEEWAEDDGNCLWWFFPIIEPPYCGSPLDCDWQERDYGEIYTHFTRINEPINQPYTETN